MIHLLALTEAQHPCGDDDNIVEQQLETYFQEHWIRSRPGVWLLATRMSPADCRDLLGPNSPVAG